MSFFCQHIVPSVHFDKYENINAQKGTNWTRLLKRPLQMYALLPTSRTGIHTEILMVKLDILLDLETDYDDTHTLPHGEKWHPLKRIV